MSVPSDEDTVREYLVTATVQFRVIADPGHLSEAVNEAEQKLEDNDFIGSYALTAVELDDELSVTFG